MTKQAMGVAAVMVLTLASPHVSKAGQDDIKSIKKLLFCGVGGEHRFNLGVAKDDPNKAILIDSTEVLNKAYDEFVKQFTAAGISLADGKAANQAALAQHQASTPDIAGKMAAVGAKQGDAGASALSGQVAAMMNNPNMSPEAREAMKKYMKGGSGAGAGLPPGVVGIPPGMQGGIQGGMAQIAADQQQKMGQTGRDLASMGAGIYDTQVSSRGNSQTKHLVNLCGKGADRSNVASKDFYAVFDKTGADGFATIDVAFSARKSSSNTVVTNISSSTSSGSEFMPRLIYTVHYFDKDGKLIWGTKKPIESKTIEVGETGESASKAILAAVPDTVAELTKELYSQ